MWSKEFKGLDEPSDQIRRLRQILTDLGMSGRMSMEQAKAIKAKREFEKELGASIRSMDYDPTRLPGSFQR